MSNLLDVKIQTQFPRSVTSSDYMLGFGTASIAKQEIARLALNIKYSRRHKKLDFYSLKRSNNKKAKNKAFFDENIVEKLFLLIYKVPKLKIEFFNFVINFQAQRTYNNENKIDFLFENLYDNFVGKRYDDEIDYQLFKENWSFKTFSNLSLEEQAFISFIILQLETYSPNGQHYLRFLKQQKIKKVVLEDGSKKIDFYNSHDLNENCKVGNFSPFAKQLVLKN